MLNWNEGRRPASPWASGAVRISASGEQTPPKARGSPVSRDGSRQGYHAAWVLAGRLRKLLAARWGVGRLTVLPEATCRLKVCVEDAFRTPLSGTFAPLSAAMRCRAQDPLECWWEGGGRTRRTALGRRYSWCGRYGRRTWDGRYSRYGRYGRYGSSNLLAPPKWRWGTSTTWQVANMPRLQGTPPAWGAAVYPREDGGRTA